MIDIIEEEFRKFKLDYKRGLTVTESNDYLIPLRHEDNYTWETISNAQEELSDRIRTYLNGKGETDYRVFHDWRVCVIHHDLEKLIAKENREVGMRNVSPLDVDICEYCSCESLDGFNYDLINNYTKDGVGTNVDIVGDQLTVEVDLGNHVIENIAYIKYCPMCRKKLD